MRMLLSICMCVFMFLGCAAKQSQKANLNSSDIKFDGMNVDGIGYKKIEIAPGKWEWVEDKAANAFIADYLNRQQQLFADLSKRKLTHQELMTVDPYINTPNGQSYFAVDKYAELYDALVKQWELQTGRKMEGYVPLSIAKGEYNKAPQEEDSRIAVETLITTLQKMPDPLSSEGTSIKGILLTSSGTSDGKAIKTGVEFCAFFQKAADDFNHSHVNDTVSYSCGNIHPEYHPTPIP